MAMWTSRLRYQGAGGISRAMFLVRQGASKFPAKFFPIIPPNTVRGKPTMCVCVCTYVCVSERVIMCVEGECNVVRGGSSECVHV